MPATVINVLHGDNFKIEVVTCNVLDSPRNNCIIWMLLCRQEIWFGSWATKANYIHVFTYLNTVFLAENQEDLIVQDVKLEGEVYEVSTSAPLFYVFSFNKASY